MQMVDFRPGDGPEVVRVPVAELGPGCVLVREAGTGRTYYTRAADVKTTPAPLWPPFPAGAGVLILSSSWSGFREVIDPVGADDWLDGFRCDAHPWHEAALWRAAAWTFTALRRRWRPDTRPKLAAVYSAVVAAMAVPDGRHFVAIHRGGWLNDSRLRELHRHYHRLVTSEDAAEFALDLYLALVPDRGVPFRMTAEQAAAFAAAGGRIGKGGKS